MLEPDAFEACFRAWVASICELIPGEVVAVDGKTLRRSHNRSKGLAALHMVSAFATANRVVLGQVATEAKSNEITAIPRLLELLHLARLHRHHRCDGLSGEDRRADHRPGR